jgi:hypothetical protein
MVINKSQGLLDPDYDRQLVALYRAWDALEVSKSGKPIIDFDLAPKRRFSRLKSREHCLSELEKFHDILEPFDSTFYDLIRQRLLASMTYLRAVLGEKISFQSYIEQTMGLTPRVFTEEEISDKRKIAVECLKKYDLSMDRKDLQRFQTIFRGRYGIDSRNLPSQFEEARSKWLPQLRRHVPTPLDEDKIQIEFASEDAYWKSWISGNLSEHPLQIRLNIHPRHHWYQGSIENLVIHEYCAHAVQIANWHKQVADRYMPEFLGILTVHFPDQYLLEGLAESLIFFLPDEVVKLEPLSVMQRDLHYYGLAILNNLHIIANEEGTQQAFDYAKERLPFTEEDVIWREIDDRTANPLFRCYQYVYGIAKDDFIRALTPLDSAHRWHLLQRIYSSPMTADQFKEMASVAPSLTPVPKRDHPDTVLY